MPSETSIDTLSGINKYYEKENENDYFEKLKNYPIYDNFNKKHSITDLVDLLSNNHYVESSKYYNNYVLNGSYRTVGECFNVIDQNTRSVLIPIGRGEEIYHKLCGDLKMCEMLSMIREAVMYSVSIFEGKFRSLCNKGAIKTLEDCSVCFFSKEYYSKDTGVTDESSEHNIFINKCNCRNTLLRCIAAATLERCM